MKNKTGMQAAGRSRNTRRTTREPRKRDGGWEKKKAADRPAMLCAVRAAALSYMGAAADG